MDKSARHTTQGERQDSIRSLETLLDYAMLEGAVLKLPMLVFLLRVARMELLNSLQADKSPDAVSREMMFEASPIERTQL